MKMVKYNRIFYILILSFSLFSVNLTGQKSEYHYFSYKIHFIHNFYHPQASNPIERFYIVPNNNIYQLYTDQEYLFNYKLTMGASFLYHFDFENNQIFLEE